MSPETFALLQNLLTREVTDVSYEEVKAALIIFSLRISISSARFSRKVNLSLSHEQTTDYTTGHIQQEVYAVRHSQPSRQKQRFRDKQRPEHAECQANTQPNRRGQKVCYRCGSLTHHHRDCPFINAVCYGCDRKGHI